MGYNRTWPSALRFGYRKHSSLQLKDTQTEVTVRKIKGMKSLLQKKESTKAIHILIAQYQHASSITYPILGRTPWPISYVISTWMKEFIRLLRKYSILLKLKNNTILKKETTQRQMHHVWHTVNDLLNHNTKRLKACRLRLQVTFLSDLSTNTDTRLSPSAFGDNKRYRKRWNFQCCKQNNPDRQIWSRDN